MNKFSGFIGTLVLAGGLVVAYAMLYGYVLSVMWNWFITSSLNAPELGIGEAIGLTLVVGFMTQHMQQPDAKDNEGDSLSRILTVIFKPLFALLCGAIVHYVFNVG